MYCSFNNFAGDSVITMQLSFDSKHSKLAHLVRKLDNIIVNNKEYIVIDVSMGTTSGLVHIIACISETNEKVELLIKKDDDMHD